MGRIYKAKSLKKRNDVDENNVVKAVTEILQNKISYRNAASKYIRMTTLHRRVKLAKDKFLGEPNLANDSGNEENVIDLNMCRHVTGKPKYKTRQIFTDFQENMLQEYLLQSSEIFFGLTFADAKKLAYEYAIQLELTNIPNSWSKNSSAGPDWMAGFMDRHPRLSLRKPENTSIARAQAFNRENVNIFFENYGNILSKYKVGPERIINLDESGITTVLDSPKVI